MAKQLGTVSGDVWTSNSRIYEDLKTGELTRVHPGSARVVCQRPGEVMPLKRAEQLGLHKGKGKPGPEVVLDGEADAYVPPTKKADVMAALDVLGVKYLKKTRVGDLAKLLEKSQP